MDFSHLARPVLPLSIDADFSQSELPRAGLTDTKIGGTPYRPVGAPWPENMYLLTQLNLGELVGVEKLCNGALPSDGLLQIFLPFVDGYGMYAQPQCHIDYWPSFTTPSEPLLFDGHDFRPEDTQPERFTTDKFGDAGIKLAHHQSALLNPSCGLRLIPGALAQQLPQLDEDIESDVPGRADILEYLESAEQSEYEAIHAQSASGGIQVGGFPYLTQTDYDAPPVEEQLLFQIDYHPHVAWLGDCGCLQIFFRDSDLSTARVCFTCY